MEDVPADMVAAMRACELGGRIDGVVASAAVLDRAVRERTGAARGDGRARAPLHRPNQSIAAAHAKAEVHAPQAACCCCFLMTQTQLVLRGELYKQAERADQLSPPAGLRPFSDGIASMGRAGGHAGEIGRLARRCAHSAGAAAQAARSGREKVADADLARFGIKITLNAVGRAYLQLRANSDEERRVWAEALDLIAHPGVPAYSAGSSGRNVRLPFPATGPLGIDLGADAGMPCVTVCQAAEHATSCGLLVGDVIVAVDNTVLRTMTIASKAFKPRSSVPAT